MDSSNYSKTVIPELTTEEKNSAIADIKIEKKDDFLTVKTIKDVMNAIVKFALPEFSKITAGAKESKYFPFP
jgi:hypothetical protein